MKRNNKLMKKVVSFCEELNALVKKVDEAKDLIEEIKTTAEGEGSDANFSVKMSTKLRKLNKQFCEGELQADIDEVKVDGEELSETKEFSNCKSLQAIKRAFKRFSEDLLELKGDISKASAAAASEVTPPEERVAIAPSAGPDSSASTDGNVVPTASVNDAQAEAVESDGKIIEPEPINFSKVRKMHVQKLFSDFEDVCEHCTDITEGMEAFTNDMVGEEDTDAQAEVSATSEEINEPINEKIEDKADFCGDKKSFCDGAECDGLKKLEDKIEEIASDVKEAMVKEGFCKDDRIEAGNKFKAFCECLDGYCSGEKSMDEAVEALENVEFFCKNLSKKLTKFATKKSFCGIMKAFDELPELVDAIEVNTTDVGTVEDPAVTETFCDEQIAKADADINEKIDKMDKLEEKVSDEKLVAFSKMTRKALKSMKCFSEEDIEAKAEQVNKLADALTEGAKTDITGTPEAVNESKCPECGAEIPDDNAEKTEEKKDENFSEENAGEAGTDEEVKSEETEDLSEEDKAIIDGFTKDDEEGTEDESTEAKATSEEKTDAEVKDESEGAEEKVSTEDTETTDVNETENFSDVDTESEDAVLTNNDIVNDVLAETAEDPAEVQDSAPVTPIANFCAQKKTATKQSSYGAWLANRANNM